MKIKSSYVTGWAELDVIFLTFYLLIILLVLPPKSVIKSVMAKFKMKKFGVVLMYELVMIVIHVNMFPGMPSIDTML